MNIVVAVEKLNIVVAMGLMWLQLMWSQSVVDVHTEQTNRMIFVRTM